MPKLTLGLVLLLGAAPFAFQKATKESAAAPGPVHARLASLAGEYTTAAEFSFGDAPPIKSTGKATLSAILDGRFLMEQNTGDAPDPGESKPTAGLRLYGYNSAADRYEGVWTYTGSTAIMNLHGTSKDGGKTLDLAATFAESAGKSMDLRVTIQFQDDDHFSVDLIAGESAHVLKTVYTRKK
jgi:hypothetical protein